MRKDQLLYFISPEYGRIHGGLGVSAERIAQALRQEAEVRVFFPDRDLPPGTYSREDEPGISYIRFNGGGDTDHSGQFVSDLLLHLSEQERPQQMLGFYAGPLSYATALTADICGVPFSCFLRGNDLDLDLFGASAVFILETIRRSRTVFCLSLEQKRKVIAVHPSTNVVIVPNGVDPVLFPRLDSKSLTSTTPPAYTTLGMFGDIKEKKGLELLLRVLSADRHKLRIVGNLRPEMSRKLHAHLLLHPEKTACIFQREFVKGIPELLDEFQKIDLLCLPSHHEGMSNVMLEAMCCGKLVLASAVGGALDVIQDGENGFLFRVRDPEDLNRALEKIERLSEEEREAIRQNARETIVERYSQTAEVQGYLQALAKTTGKLSSALSVSS